MRTRGPTRPVQAEFTLAADIKERGTSFTAAILSKTFRPARTILRNMGTPPSEKRPKEETLELVDWPEFRRFAHNVLDDAISMPMASVSFLWGRAFPTL